MFISLKFSHDHFISLSLSLNPSSSRLPPFFLTDSNPSSQLKAQPSFDSKLYTAFMVQCSKIMSKVG
ncbi:hypothetical protein L6452_39478 [Arctium lappa]|uniref:Uncharacterized protein n=1 Tax=Arctium lappa TaxID=4217 RepID=A0ACB8XSE0_ARCLA|nr:hypothetical protein L6452_39478 [Arctium lappa]